MRKILVAGAILIGILVIIVFASWANYQLQGPGYTLEQSEGSCQIDNQCQWACARDRGICTDNIDQYKGKQSFLACDLANYDSPMGPIDGKYQCGCITSLKKCGWKKWYLK